VLERKTLPEVDVTPEQNAGTSVNPAGWRADRPPLGWPDEAREFAPGEGPRREEDFLLHIAPFPVFVVPPETWEGIVSLAGHGGHGTHASYVPTRIEFEYLDIPGEPTRGMHVVNVDSSEEDSLEKRYPPIARRGFGGLMPETMRHSSHSCPAASARRGRERPVMANGRRGADTTLVRAS
jgi:hypothetical protein